MQPLPKLESIQVIDTPEVSELTPQIAELFSALEPYRLEVKGKTTYYILPSELNFLAETPDDGQVLPKEFTILAAFDEKGLAGRTTLVPLPHIEGTWVREDLRKSRVAYTLLREVEKSIRAAGRSHAWAFVEESNAEITNYMERLGYKKQPFTVWVKDMTDELTSELTESSKEI